MKPGLALMLFAGIALCSVPRGFAQELDLGEFSIPTITEEESSNDEFTIAGALLSQATEELSGGEFSLSGEITGLVAGIPSSVGVELTIGLSDGGIEISWPDDPKLALEVTGNLGDPAAWEAADRQRELIGAKKSLRGTQRVFEIIAPARTNLFFRLRIWE